MNRVLGNAVLCGIAVITSTTIRQAAVLGQCELIKLSAKADAGLNDEFGTSVAIGGDYAVVGAWRDDDNGDDSGSAYVFKRTGLDWSLVQKLTASNAASEDRFGVSVTIEGDYIVVGAPNGDAAPDNVDTGTAYVFFNDGSGNWTQQGAPLVVEIPTDGDHFGYSVAISGNVIAVGARRHVEIVDNEGAVFVFRRAGTDWALEPGPAHIKSLCSKYFH